MAALASAYQSIFYLHELPSPLLLGWVALWSGILLWLSTWVFEQRREEFAEFI
jgi:ABC-type polysaccharide/polyol phosphate export permease